MKKIFKIILVLSLLLTVITGCDKADTSAYNQTGEIFDKYLDLLVNYTPRAKTDSTELNLDFEAFLDEIFKETLEDNYTFYHFNIENPSLLGVNKPEVTLGEVSFDTTEDIDEMINNLDELHSFDYDTLSRRQQLDYESYEYSLYETILQLEYGKYESPYTQGNDIIGNLITTFTEFKFRSDEDVLDYLNLLSDFDRYLADVMAFSKEQYNHNVKLSDHSIDEASNYIDSLLSKTDDFVLITEFSNNLKEYGNYSDEAGAISKNKEIILNEVIPALKETKEYLLSKKLGVNVESLAMCYINRDFAKAKYLVETSSSFDIDEIFSNTEEFFMNSVNKYIKGSYDETSYYEYLNALDGAFEPFNLGYEDTLVYLKENIKQLYKDIGDVDFTISPLDSSSAQNTILAYYMSSPVDNLNQNVIRVNENTLADDILQTYTTLAHEGFPGHLFQNAYSLISGTSNFRAVLNFNGYTEGYGVYAQNLALELANFKGEYTKDIIEFVNSYYFTLYSLIDIGINYYGWSRKDFKAFMDKIGIYDKSTYDDMADVFFEIFTDMPGVYCSYGIGYVNFSMLKEEASNYLGKRFSYPEFNDVILKDGSLPFVMVRQNVLDYIETNK